MQRKSLNLLLLVIPITALAACGSNGGDSNTPPPSPPPTTTVSQEDTFGVAFGTAFRADANAQPIEPKDGDIIQESLTASPTEIK